MREYGGRHQAESIIPANTGCYIFGRRSNVVQKTPRSGFNLDDSLLFVVQLSFFSKFEAK